MRLHHKLILVFSVVSLAVLAIGAAGLFVVSGIGEELNTVLEGKVAVVDASGEIVSIVASTETLLQEHMRIEDLDRMDQIREEMENYHKIDDMWMLAITHGTESREFIESEEYQLWTKYGYEAKGIVIQKAGPDVVPIIEEMNANHKKFHETAKRLMELHKEKIRVRQDMLDTYSKEKEYRHSVRNAVIAQGDYLILSDMWRAEYEGKEALFQYRDKEHMDEWIEALETLETDVANSNFTPEIKSEILNYSAEYLLLARKISGYVFKLDKLDAEMQSQTSILRGYTTDIDANVGEIRAAALAARIDAKRQVEAYIVEMYTVLAVVTAVVIALIWSVGYFTNKFISQPIIKLGDATRKTAEGDFDVKIRVDRGDEIGDLGTAFNEMAAALKKRTTELEKINEELRDSEERFRELFENSVDGICTLDREGRFTRVNRVMEEMTGYRKEELLGMKKLDLVDKHSKNMLKKRLESLLEGETPLPAEFKMMTKEGEPIDIEVRSAPIKKEGRVVGVQESAREISFRKALEHELESVNQELLHYSFQLEHSNRLMGLFTDILRHDLLNPIGIIANIADIMEEDENLEDSAELAIIKRNVKKLDGIVRNASDYAKLESAELERKELDLTKVIKSVIDDFGPYIKGKGMKVEFKKQGKQKTNASPMLESVFANILSNSIKYSPGGTEIKIAIEDAGKNWKISFADRGEGILDEHKEKIFDRFTRKDKLGVKGTGLGLAIVKRIVELHRGKVWVVDNPGGGSIFYVELPK